jgi:hypothetical protein
MTDRKLFGIRLIGTLVTALWRGLIGRAACGVAGAMLSATLMPMTRGATGLR